MTLSAAARAELLELGYNPDEPALEQRLVDEQVHDLQWLEAAQRDYPLAFALLWRNAAAEIDQQRAVLAILNALWIAVIQGGNRAGKSEGCKQLIVAMALGRQHPIVQMWARQNRIPLELIPEGPGITYAVAQTHHDSIRYHRDSLERILGAMPFRWFGRNDEQEARIEIVVAGYDYPAKIYFKAVKQGGDSFQGDDVRFIWIDEEPLGEVGREVMNECKIRVARLKGTVAVTCALLNGHTWFWQRYDRDRLDHVVYMVIDALDSPYVDRDFFERVVYADMDADELARRRFGAAAPKHGLIYRFRPWGTRWDDGHLCDPFEIPADWPRFRGGDFGLDDPVAVLWGALGDDVTLYLYREYFVSDARGYRWHGEQVLELQPDDEVIEASWGDPSARAALDAWAELDLYFAKANNDVRGGIDAVRSFLRLRADGRPRLKVFRGCCPNLEREIAHYQKNPKMVAETPIKRDDHAMDALKYMAIGIREYRGM